MLRYETGERGDSILDVRRGRRGIIEGAKYENLAVLERMQECLWYMWERREGRIDGGCSGKGFAFEYGGEDAAIVGGESMREDSGCLW